MRYIKLALLLSAIGFFASAVFLNWHIHLETQRKLDALATAVSRCQIGVAQTTPPAAATQESRSLSEPDSLPIVNWECGFCRTAVREEKSDSVTVAPSQIVPIELAQHTASPYIIEAPDQLTIEVSLKNPKTNKTEQLPKQPVTGGFLVRPDGTVGLGMWGSVPVSGLTIDEAAKEVRKQLEKQFLLNVPGVSPADLCVAIDVLASNSKRYYIITDLEGKGETVFAFPLTGSKTVLDAITTVDGLSEAAKQGKVKLARRKEQNGNTFEVLPVDWLEISRGGKGSTNYVSTNYVLLPGDRIYVTSGK